MDASQNTLKSRKGQTPAEGAMPPVRFYVRGMHCPSCELLVLSRLQDQRGVSDVRVSLHEGTVSFGAEDPETWTPEALEALFQDQPYRFSREREPQEWSRRGALLGVLAVVGLGVLLARWDLGSLIDLDPTSSLGVVALFGVLAGCSSCAALVGGMVLALAPRWKGWGPHGAFAVGRLGAFLGGGALLGALGAGVRPSPLFSSLLVFGVALFMAGVGLSMLGLSRFPRFGGGGGVLERFFGSRALASKGPWLAGALSLFLPCGFSLTVQGLALASGSPGRGAALMGAFALGTLPSLAIIGFSGATWGGARGVWCRKAAGALVVAAAVWSVNTQLNVLGLPSLSDLGTPPAVTEHVATAPTPLPGPQELTMEAGSRSYAPRSFTVKAGLPVRWHIVDKGFSGCTNAIQAPGLFEGVRPLVRGGTATVAFTPERPGIYKFGCWMGMITGEIRVE